jgi:hypothetical protein
MNPPDDLVRDWLFNEGLEWVEPSAFDGFAVPLGIATISGENLARIGASSGWSEYTTNKLREALQRLKIYMVEATQDGHEKLPIVDSPGTLRELLELLQQMADAIRIDSWRDHARRIVCAAYAEVGEFQRALEFAQTLSDYGRNQVLGMIVTSHSQAGQVGDGLDVALLIDDATVRSSALCALCRGADELTDDVFDELVWTALDSARDIAFEPARADALCEVASLLIKAGKTSEAYPCIQEAVHAAEHAERERRAVDPLSTAAALLWSTGHRASAESQWKRALLVARADEDGYFGAEGVMSVIQSMLESSGVERALDVARDISWSYDRDRALVLIVRWCCTCDDLSRARELIDLIEGRDQQIEGLCHLVSRHAIRGDQGPAVQLLGAHTDREQLDLLLGCGSHASSRGVCAARPHRNRWRRRLRRPHTLGARRPRTRFGRAAPKRALLAD